MSFIVCFVEENRYLAVDVCFTITKNKNAIAQVNLQGTAQFPSITTESL